MDLESKKKIIKKIKVLGSIFDSKADYFDYVNLFTNKVCTGRNLVNSHCVYILQCCPWNVGQIDPALNNDYNFNANSRRKILKQNTWACWLVIQSSCFSCICAHLCNFRYLQRLEKGQAI